LESPQTAVELSKPKIIHLEEEDMRLTHEIAWLFPRQGEWTEDGYFRLPETNHFVELSEGRLVIPEMPTDSHQYTVGELFVEMRAFVRNNVLGKIRIAPLPVKLWQGKIREPDIVFMSAEHTDRIGEDFWGVPDMVVEVLSKSTMKTDREEKFLEYAQAGVMEYWIVDLEECAIEVYVLKQKAYKLFGKWGVEQRACSEILAGFEVAVETIIAG